ncbi:MAG: SDR family NAD(P)-dependent oxidoreductase [Acidimicrobiia bacterium]|nr:SDR family NAD(P)-dependent oxidoreductase [Acidimicrobiia bacterium]
MSQIVFDRQVAVVTGAGGGLGKTYALELARRGARVVVNDLGGSVDGSGGASSMADATVADILAAGGEAVASYESVATPEGGAAVIETALDTFGTVDVVVNNAGILRDKSFANMDMDSVHAVMDVHLNGAFHVSQPAFRVMKENGYGRFVFTASASGIFGNFGQTNYGAAKMGLVGLMNVVAVEGAKYNIRSNAIAPVARTRMTEDLLGPMIDYVDPEQVTPLVAYLASAGCAESHEIWTVGGGRYARIFVGVNDGWFAGRGEVPTAEDIRDHLSEIRDIGEFIIPMSSTEELQILGRLLEADGT